MKKLLIGGSPCTHWSIAQHNGRETEASGIGWELFKCYLAAKEKFKPEDWELGKLYDTPAPAKPEPKQEACEETDLSDAPEEIKETILKNDELLRAKESPEKTEQPTATLGTINATERLRKLANERKTLADLHPNDDRFAGDVIAIEYAVGVLEAMGL